MIRETSHEAMEQLIAAHATRSLEPASLAGAEREILEHIASCDDCRAVFRDFREVAGDLALATPAIKPPARVESRILSVIRGEQPVPAGRGGRSVSTRLLAIAAAFVLVAVGGLATFAASLSNRLERGEVQARTTARALSIVSGPDTRTTTLSGEGGSILLAYTPQGDAVLLAQGLPAVPSGRVMELWLIRDGVAYGVGVFRPERGMLVAPVAMSPNANDTIAITIERGNVDKPTTAPIYSGLVV